MLSYAQERYLANHVVMSAVDKLHKLYGTDNEAVVWARSVGIEIMNELDSMKAALMMFVGAQSTKTSNIGSAPLNVVGNAVKTLATTAKSVGAVKAAIAGSLSSVIDNFAKSGRP